MQGEELGFKRHVDVSTAGVGIRIDCRNSNDNHDFLVLRKTVYRPRLGAFKFANGTVGIPSTDSLERMGLAAKPIYLARWSHLCGPFPHDLFDRLIVYDV